MGNSMYKNQLSSDINFEQQRLGIYIYVIIDNNGYIYLKAKDY